MFPNSWRESKLSPHNNNYQYWSLQFLPQKSKFCAVVPWHRVLNGILHLEFTFQSLKSEEFASFSSRTCWCYWLYTSVVTGKFSVTEWKGKSGSLNLVFCCFRNHFKNLLCRSLKGVGLGLPGRFVSELLRARNHLQILSLILFRTVFLLLQHYSSS